MASSSHARVAFHADRQLYYKEFLPRGPQESLKALLRGSRGTRARLNSDALLAAGFRAPESVAWGRLPGRREYLFTRAARGESVLRWLREYLDGRDGTSLAMRRQLIAELGGFVGRLHAAGFIHGDLRSSNVLAARTNGGFNFTLIDNERNLHTVPPPGRGLLRNLMQLNMMPPAKVSRTDRIRFFRRWRREMTELTDIEAKVVAAEAYLWAMRRLREKGKL